MVHLWEQGKVRLVMPSSYYYQYCMNGGGHIGQLRKVSKLLVDFRM